MMKSRKTEDNDEDNDNEDNFKEDNDICHR